MSEIIINHAKKMYDDITIIEDLNVTIPDGSLFTLLGPSGCGKTTLLRMIAGFNSIEGGDFYFGNERINDKEPSKRNIGMVFQNYAIFPHLTVKDNVAFGLKQKKVSKDILEKETQKYLSLMQIADFSNRKPAQLSGGQQQRVAIARAIVTDPLLLLADEPTGNLDSIKSIEVMELLKKLNEELNITIIMVTHEEEMAAYASRVIYFRDGNIEDSLKKGFK